MNNETALIIVLFILMSLSVQISIALLLRDAPQGKIPGPVVFPRRKRK